MLAHTGKRLQQLSRKQDMCFRYGGDEFVVLMPETDAEEAFVQAAALHRALMETHFRMKNGLELTVSASVGLATYPTDGIGAADARMYGVKADGRGRVYGT